MASALPCEEGRRGRIKVLEFQLLEGLVSHSIERLITKERMVSTEDELRTAEML